MEENKEPDSSRELLVNGAQMLGLELSEECADQMIKYLQLLDKWNQVTNLTAITDTESMVNYHLLDSLSLARYVKGRNLLDVGTGAGLPGIPLAMANPELEVTLLDSNGKKIRFVTQVLIDLALPNVNVVQSRIESYRPKGEGFDNITCRAFGDLKTFRDLTDSLVSKGGQRLAMKGKTGQEPDEKDWRSIKVQLPFTEDQRHILVC